MDLKIWDIPSVDREGTAALARECGIPPLLAALLRARGADTPGKAREFLSPEGFCDPYAMKDMDAAVERIGRAIDDFEHIAVYGDYDADGVTATAMLYTYLQDRGASVSFYIPQRESEGYGMNMAAVDTLSREGADLIITVDNGVSANEEIAYAKSLGMDVVVTDHHQPHELLPDAPVVDPHREDDGSGLVYLCGAGVVLKLLTALEGDADAVLERYADLAALGTVGDSVPLVGENRLIVKLGLESMAKRQRPGLAALLSLMLGDSPAASTDLSFKVIPCLNSPGRIGTPESAVRLLTCQDAESAELLAEETRDLNETRKELKAGVVEAARAVLEKRPELQYDRVLVVWGEGWHHGLVGLAASSLSELYCKPCIVLSVSGGEARGSGRSLEGFDLFRAVTDCEDLLTRHGGHPMAVGMTLPPENLEEFRRRINEYAGRACPRMPFAVVKPDYVMPAGGLVLSACGEIAPLEPFGEGNPTPLFAIMGVTITEVRGLGSNGGHCKLCCKADGVSFECLRFGAGPEDFPYPPGSVVDMAVTIEENRYRGSVSLSVQVQHMRLSGLDSAGCLRDYRAYEKFRRGEALTSEEAARLRPTRDQLAAVYTLLPKAAGPKLGLEDMVLGLERRGLNMGMLLLGLEVLRERKLIEYSIDGSMLTARKLPFKGKTDITLSPVFGELDALIAGGGQEKE